MFSTHLGSANMVLQSATLSACSTPHSQSLVWDKRLAPETQASKSLSPSARFTDSSLRPDRCLCRHVQRRTGRCKQSVSMSMSATLVLVTTVVFLLFFFPPSSLFKSAEFKVRPSINGWKHSSKLFHVYQCTVSLSEDLGIVYYMRILHIYSDIFIVNFLNSLPSLMFSLLECYCCLATEDKFSDKMRCSEAWPLILLEKKRQRNSLLIIHWFNWFISLNAFSPFQGI